MGIFGSKKSDEHGSGVLKSESRGESGEASGAHRISGGVTTGEAILSMGELPSSGEYGIAEATKLMRSLPQDNSDLVVRVVVATLESVNVSISRLIEDAHQAENRLESTISALNKEIKDFEKEIVSRKDRIRTLEDELKQTTVVRERLIQAERARTAKVGPAPKPDSKRGLADSPSGSGFRVAPLRPGE